MTSQRVNSSTSLDSRCCATCKADVEISRNTIHGAPDDLYNNLIRNNGYPDEADVYKKEWEAAKIRLDRLKATIFLLQAERRRLEGIAGKYRQILHPVRKAPVEVLQHLFTFCVDGGVGQEENSLVPSQMPWVLGQISRNWRNVALSTPHLWDKVSLEIRQGTSDITSGQSISADAHRLSLQLHHSQNVPLIVSLSGGQITSEILINVHPLLFLICACSRRWKSLHLKGDPQSLRRLSSTRGLLPQLEKLIIGWNEWNVNQPGDATDYFEFAPRLKSICLHTFTSQTLPWRQIQHFDFKRPRPWPGSPTDSDKLWAMIKELARVKFCDIYFDSGFSINHMRSTTSVSGKIETYITALTLSGSYHAGSTNNPGGRGDAVIPLFLEGISTPRLSHLQITSSFAGWSELLSLLKRSNCKLAVLMIPEARSLSPEILNRVLSAVPDLKILEIGFLGGAGNGHISAFSAPVVPNLESLTIVQVPIDNSSYDDSVMVDMLVHRWNRGASPSLRFVSLDHRINDELSREKLDTLIAQGMTVVEQDDRELDGDSEVDLFS
ncbi:hypothetical protein VNI00_014288 [Paramarasmius palmivorus]|uniref:F-box domain-containing protein n=1 Tax=Paramarasmius palmivorus TaxID=297713 RepID=A0AAW0BTX4_9AGAR